jgi:hypothetical protein
MRLELEDLSFHRLAVDRDGKSAILRLSRIIGIEAL